MPCKTVHTLGYLNMHVDLHIISTGRVIKSHSHLTILEIIFISKCRTWIVEVVVMMIMAESVAVLVGYLQPFMPPPLTAPST